MKQISTSYKKNYENTGQNSTLMVTGYTYKTFMADPVQFLHKKENTSK